jgi:hypothetical protein
MSKTVNVKFRKAHPQYSYFPGDTGKIDAVSAEKLLDEGYIIIVPEKDDVINPLPEDLPVRDILFDNGFDTVDKIREAGSSLTDVKGIGKNTLKLIHDYLEQE